MKSIEVKSSIHISLPADLLQQLNNYSGRLGKSRNQIIETLLEEWVEDQNDIMLAEQVISSIKKGEKKIVSWEEMEEIINKDD